MACFISYDLELNRPEMTAYYLVKVDFVVLSLEIQAKCDKNELTLHKTIPGSRTLAVCTHFQPKLHVVMMSLSVD